uniref:Uncharacterized protein n=1 Tax=Romanomermis culicivorax TaxID=13658 RepID=A0A915IV20_ROMCU
MGQTLSALPTNKSAQGHSLPTLESDNACCCSGFAIACLATAAAKICDASQCKPVNDAKNHWRRQHGHIISTDGRYSGAFSPFCCPGTTAQNS